MSERYRVEYAGSNLAYWRIMKDDRVIDICNNANGAEFIRQKFEHETSPLYARIAELEALNEKRTLALRHILNELNDLANNPPLSSDTMAGELGRTVDRLRTVYKLQLDVLSSVTDANICEFIFSDEDMPNEES